MGRLFAAGAIGVLSSLVLAGTALADGPNRESTQGDLKGKAAGVTPAAGGPAQPAKTALPVTLTIVAPTPDPPWTMKVENTGDHPIRIAADVRLLTFELQKKTGGTLKCAAPAGLRPSRFPNDRELYLKPGESFQENFDPRLFCFNQATDALTGGTIVHPHLGFGATARPTGPFAAEGTDRPEAFAALPRIDGPTIVLSYRAVAPMGDDAKDPFSGALSGDKQPTDKPASDKTADKGKSKSGKKDKDKPKEKGKKEVASKKTDTVDRAAIAVGPQAKQDPRTTREKSAAEQKATDPFAYDRSADAAQPKVDQDQTEVVDPNKERVEVYVDRFTEASAARDIVLNVKAENEGRHDLVTALRGRMLSFSIEQLAPDGTTRNTMDCSGSVNHGTPADAMHDIGAGQAATVPLLLAEFCPVGTFNRPGLYRVLPRIDTSVDGEALKLHAYIGQALARQSTLIRLATAKDAFEDEAPIVTPAPAPAPSDSDASQR